MKEKFMEFIEKMDMSYSYKPVLLKGIFDFLNEDGRVKIEDLIDYLQIIMKREEKMVNQQKKKRCIYLREFTRSEVKRNILSNPFKRFEDMNFMKISKDIEYIEISRYIIIKLEIEEIQWIKKHSDTKLKEHFGE